MNVISHLNHKHCHHHQCSDGIPTRVANIRNTLIRSSSIYIYIYIVCLACLASGSRRIFCFVYEHITHKQTHINTYTYSLFGHFGMVYTWRHGKLHGHDILKVVHSFTIGINIIEDEEKKITLFYYGILCYSVMISAIL